MSWNKHIATVQWRLFGSGEVRAALGDTNLFDATASVIVWMYMCVSVGVCFRAYMCVSVREFLLNLNVLNLESSFSLF